MPEPQFEFGDFYTIIFYKKQHVSAGEEKGLGKIQVETRVEKFGERFGEKFEESSGKTSDRIIKMMGDNSRLTIPELAETLGITTRAIEKQISRLQKDGKLKRVGPAKGGYWQVIDNE